MANIPKDLLERVSFMGRVIKNAGLSANEAAKGLEALSNSFAPIIWTEKIRNNIDTDLYFREFMQQQIEPASTYASTTHPDEEISIELLEKAQNQIARRNEELMDFSLRNQPVNGPDQCPFCMRQAAWYRSQRSNVVHCEHCNTEFDQWALENVDFPDLRNQVLELKLRQREQELQQQREQDIAETQMQSEPSPDGRMSFELADEIRTLIRHRGDLTATQMTRLNELIGIAQGSPAPSYDNYSISEQPYQTRTRRLVGQGIFGDAVLTGNEERLEFYETEERINVGILSARERYFAKEKIKEKDSVKPLSPLKRKLDI
jgi:hypothetical protein